jgi:predicted nucleic acid-binding Zn ribbon protein
VTRYCFFCGKPIPVERLRKNRKTRFCTDECRAGDRNDARERKRAERLARGACVSCGRKLPRGKQEGGLARVQTVLEVRQ